MNGGARVVGGGARVVAAAVALALSVPWPAAGAPAGSPAPPFSLADRDGRNVRLADLAGRVLVVDFWASWCSPCKKSFPELDALYGDLHPRGLEVLAVSVDENRKDADAFLATHPWRLTVLFDPQAKTAEAFRVDGMPSTFVIDRRGLIRFRHEGYTQGTAAAIRRQVEELLAERGAGETFAAAQPTNR